MLKDNKKTRASIIQYLFFQHCMFDGSNVCLDGAVSLSRKARLILSQKMVMCSIYLYESILHYTGGEDNLMPNQATFCSYLHSAEIQYLHHPVHMRKS